MSTQRDRYRIVRIKPDGTEDVMAEGDSLVLTAEEAMDKKEAELKAKKGLKMGRYQPSGLNPIDEEKQVIIGV